MVVLLLLRSAIRLVPDGSDRGHAGAGTVCSGGVEKVQVRGSSASRSRTGANRRGKDYLSLTGCTAVPGTGKHLASAFRDVLTGNKKVVDAASDIMLGDGFSEERAKDLVGTFCRARSNCRRASDAACVFRRMWLGKIRENGGDVSEIFPNERTSSCFTHMLPPGIGTFGNHRPASSAASSLLPNLVLTMPTPRYRCRRRRWSTSLFPPLPPFSL
jgi:hypothetical protein